MGKVLSIFRRRKDASLDVAEAQLRDLNAVVTKEETRRNSLVTSRRKVMSKLLWWGLLIVVLAIAWAGASVHFDWISVDGGYYHLLPALVVPILLGSFFDFRIKRANFRIGKLQTQKAKVVDDLENSDDFKKFIEQKKKWDQLALLKRDPTSASTPAKASAPAPLSQSSRTPVRPQAPPQRPQPPSTPLSSSVPSATPAATPASKAGSLDTIRPPPSAAKPVETAPATPAPAPVLAAAPSAATPKAYYQPVMRSNVRRPVAPSSGAAPLKQPEKGMLAWLTNAFIGDEEDDRYTAVPLMCQYCGAQNGLRENTHFKTTYYEFSCRSCHKVNQLRSAESLSDILAFAGDGKPTDAPAAPAAAAPAAVNTNLEPESEPEPKTPQAKKDE